MKVDYMRQQEIFDPTNQKYNIVVFGVGSLGSFITLNLAKLGFNNISVYDFDIVEDYNLPNQFYRIQDIGKLKVEALKQIVKEFTDVEINAVNEKVDNGTFISTNLNTIFIVTFDSLSARKIVYDMFRNYHNYLIDARMGGEEYQIVTSMMDNEIDLKRHDAEFNIVETDIRCGMKSVIYSVLSISSEVCNIVKKIDKEESIPKKLNRHMKRNFILSDLK